jgi:hypothetical protein
MGEEHVARQGVRSFGNLFIRGDWAQKLLSGGQIQTLTNQDTITLLTKDPARDLSPLPFIEVSQSVLVDWLASRQLPACRCDGNDGIGV